MFTVDSLIDTAIVSDAIARDWIALPLDLDDRGYRATKHDHYERSIDAINVALYMEKHEITEVASIGPFEDGIRGTLSIGSYATVMVKKGSAISSRSARLNRSAGRDYKVKVQYVTKGSVNINRGDISVHNARVSWLSDGYTCSTDRANVIRV
jgi:hypothetical protein